MKNCTYCGLENADDVAHCRGCGTPFVTESADSQDSRPSSSESPERAAANLRMLYGALWCIGGIVVTSLSYTSAANSPSGGTYVVAWGAIVFGAVRFFQGLSGRPPKPISRDDMGFAALAHGAQLESAGQVKEALAVYQSIIEKYADSEAGKDAKKSIENLQGKVD
jgi:hypothetical protein